MMNARMTATGVALLALGLSACGHSGHQPIMSGMDHGKPDCMMMTQMGKDGMAMGGHTEGSMPMAHGKMDKDGQMMAQSGCPTMGAKEPAPAKPGDAQPEHHN